VQSLVTGLSVVGLRVPSTNEQGDGMTTMTDAPRRVTGGTDTHKDTHVVVALDELGRQVGVASFPTTPAGYRALLRWLRDAGEVVAVGVEGTGAWGAGVARYLTAEGVRVIEVQRPNRQDRRRHGKSDPTDALSAARAVQAGRERSAPKSADGMIECVRLIRVARRSAIRARSQVANQIYSLTDTAPDELRTQLRDLEIRTRIVRAARFHLGALDTPVGAAKLALRTLARRWLALEEEVTTLDRHLTELVEAAAPSLVALNGVGTQCAAVFLTAAGDNPHRLHNEQSYAALCGSSPRDASSGKQRRHRLNRGGDREANSALYIVVISRLRWDRRTKDYMDRRLAQGKTRKEVIRCLKRYVVREIYSAITHDFAFVVDHAPTLEAAA
jgi:transposase